MTETRIFSPYAYKVKRKMKSSGVKIAPFTKEQIARLDAMFAHKGVNA